MWWLLKFVTFSDNDMPSCMMQQAAMYYPNVKESYKSVHEYTGWS
jgi:hypothetical protein